MRPASYFAQISRLVNAPDSAPLRLVVIAILVVCACRGVAQQAPLRTLVSAASVHDLPQAATSGAQVDLRAAVTYYDPSENLLFVQDESGGVFVNVAKPFPIAVGDFVSLRGSILYGFRAGVAPDVRIRVLGLKGSPHPQNADYGALASGRLDCRLVRVTGMVRDAVIEEHPESHSKTLHIDMTLDHHGELEVYLRDYRGVNAVSLPGKRVSLTGVTGSAVNAKQQMNGVVLYARDSRDLQVLNPEQQASAALPLSSSDDVFSAVQVRDTSPRLRLRGTVVYYAPGEFAVLDQGAGKTLYVQTRQTSGIAVGDIAEAYGFPDDRKYSPSLRDAILFSTHQHERILPTPLSYEDALSGLYADRLITIEGRVLSQLRSKESTLIALDVDGHVVRGVLQDSSDIPNLGYGSVVRMSGICSIVTGGPWKAPVLFSLWVRTASDIQILHDAPWWNVRHLAELLGTLLWLALLVMLWAIILRRRVVRQAALIAQSMSIAEKRSAILKQISLNVPVEQVLDSVASAVELLLANTVCIVSRVDTAALDGRETGRRVFHLPLLRMGEPVGAFSIFTSHAQVLSNQQEVFLMLEELIPLALNNRALHEQLIYKSTHDSLTNLPNRRLCEEHLDRHIAEARAVSACITVIYVDVDKFKAVNDQFGHWVGDLYLQAIGSRLSAELSPNCTIARVGGDEFVVLIPDCDREQGRKALSRLRNCFTRPFTLASISMAGSASFGMALYPVDGATREELEQHADLDMYAVKSSVSQIQPVSGGSALSMAS